MLRNRPLMSRAGGQLYDELEASREFARPVPWLDKLTLRQKARVVEINSHVQYDDWAAAVDEWMDAWPLLSLDTESAIGSPLPSTVQVAFGRSMWAIIFRVDDLRTEKEAWGMDYDDVTLLDILPARFVRWLCSTNIFILVSGAEEKYFPGVDVYDVQELMYSHRASFKYSNPQVKILDGAKTGLAMVSMVANGYTHKPIKKKVAERWFAHLALPEGRFHGYSKWPSWRIPTVLYHWKVPYDVAAWYRIQDVWTPLSFAFMLVQRRLQLHNNWEGSYTNAWAWSVIRDVISPHRNEPRIGLEGFEWTILVWEWNELQEPCMMTSSLALEPSGPRDTGVAGASSSPQLGCQVEASTSSRPLKRKQPDEDHQENISGHPGVFDRELERPYKRRKKGRSYAEPLVLSVKLRAQNARVMYPEMGQRCGFCGGSHHTYAFGLVQVACPYARAALNYSGAISLYPRCTYARCEIHHLHYTRVCPTLHSLCHRCELRGHMGGCLATKLWVKQALEDFEAVADEGVYTSRRHLDKSWGFYPSSGTSAEPSYADLLMMDPFSAFSLSKTLCPRRITTTMLWRSSHENAPLFRANRPEQYDLRRRR